MRPVKITMADYGTSFATRARAAHIGAVIQGKVTPKTRELILDFADVRALSYSFADELFIEVLRALCTTDHEAEARFIHCADDLVSAFRATTKKRDRFEEHKLQALTERNGLAITAIAGA